MKNRIISIVIAFIFIQATANASEVEYSGLAEISVGTVLGSETFLVNGRQNGHDIDEGIYDNSSFLTTIGGGLDATSRELKFQLIGSIGRITNGDLSSVVLKFDVAAYYMGSHTNKLGVGLHLATYSFLSPSWGGSANLKLTDNSAVSPGVAVIFGDQIQIKASVDYLMGSSFNVKAPDGVNVSGGSVTVDGPMVQLALLYKF